MEWVVLVLGILVAGSVGMAWDDKRKSKKAGEPIGSLWWHYKQALAKSEKESQAKKAAKLKRKAEENQRKATAVGVSAETSVVERESIPEAAQPKESLHKIQAENRQSIHEAMSSKAWKKKARKTRESAEPAPVPQAGSVTERTPELVPERIPEPVPEPESASVAVSVSEPVAESRPPIKPREQWSAPYPVSLRFTYRDSKGAISTRELNNWRVSDRRLRGFDLDRGGARTFRLDRIVEVAEGHEALEEAKHNPAQEAPEPVSDQQRQGPPEIHFSGFSSDTKRSLERTAEAHGFIVRKSVTKNLDFFCRGPRPSQDKLAKATEKPGCSVIDKDGFLWVIATGEIPLQEMP